VTDLHRNLIRSMKRRRAMLAISQMELAERAGISSGYVGEVEMGRKFPSPEILERIAGALGIRPYRLFMSDEDAASAAGPEAVYEAADRLKHRLGEEIDDMVRDFSPDDGRPAKG
jgi:transcriptional regulator with XRE-family HTH domain